MRFNYYADLGFRRLERVQRRTAVGICEGFFTAPNMRTLEQNVQLMEKGYIESAHISKIKMGIRSSFQATSWGSRIQFEGIADRVVELGGYKHLKIQITPKVHFYHSINADGYCCLEQEVLE